MANWTDFQWKWSKQKKKKEKKKRTVGEAACSVVQIYLSQGLIASEQPDYKQHENTEERKKRKL